MLGSVSRGLARSVRKVKLEASLLQQIRLLNIHEYQVQPRSQYNLMHTVKEECGIAREGRVPW